MAMRKLTWEGVWRRRLARHSLLEPAPRERLADVVGAVCGIHAQIMASAELSIGLRVEGVTARDVRDELWERRTLVKTVGLRGTIHLFPSVELPTWLAVLRARTSRHEDRKLDVMGIDRGQADAIVEAMRDALDGQRLTTAELGAEVVRRVGAWAAKETFPAFAGMWPRWRPLVGMAAVGGALCYGPNRGTEVTFVRPDQWLGWANGARGGPGRPDRRAALGEVLRRYLSAYGPATPEDFAPWFATDPAAARDLFRTNAGDLEEVDVEGTRGWLPAGEAERPAPWVGDPVRLLPHFDCYAVGCRPRDRLIPIPIQEAAGARGRRRVDLHGPSPVLLVDGLVAGVWDRRRAGRRLAVRVEPYRRLSARHRRALEGEAARVGRIVGAEPELSFGPVRTRPHL